MHNSGLDGLDRFLISAIQENLNNRVQYRLIFKINPHLFLSKTYQRALHILIEQQEELRPGLIMHDFEKGFHQVVENVFGENLNIKALNINTKRLSQFIWRRIQEHNLVRMYRENEELQQKMKMLAALAFVPPNLVLHYFEVLSDEIPAALEPLYNYFEDNYLGRPTRHVQRRTPNFAIEMLSMYQRADLGLPRFNNAVEGWDRAFQYTLGYAHPTVLIQIIQFNVIRTIPH